MSQLIHHLVEFLGMPSNVSCSNCQFVTVDVFADDKQPFTGFKVNFLTKQSIDNISKFMTSLIL